MNPRPETRRRDKGLALNLIAQYNKHRIAADVSLSVVALLATPTDTPAIHQ